MSSGEVINMEKIADDLSIFHTGLWLIPFFSCTRWSKVKVVVGVCAVMGVPLGIGMCFLCAYFMSCQLM